MACLAWAWFNRRIRSLNQRLRARVNRLEEVLPICANCKRIRKPDSDPMDQGSWLILENHIRNRTGANFTHGLCPGCLEALYADSGDQITSQP